MPNLTRNTKGNEMIKFEIGKTYKNRSICDSNMFFEITVISRTEKTIKATVDGAVKTLRPAIYNECEFVKPWGSYSMCPIIKAN
jgi:hypothetical protein